MSNVYFLDYYTTDSNGKMKWVYLNMTIRIMMLPKTAKVPATISAHPNGTSRISNSNVIFLFLCLKAYIWTLNNSFKIKLDSNNKH